MSGDYLWWICLAVGVFIGNALVVPLLMHKTRTFRDGLGIGLIAAAIILVVGTIVNWL